MRLGMFIMSVFLFFIGCSTQRGYFVKDKSSEHLRYFSRGRSLVLLNDRYSKIVIAKNETKYKKGNEERIDVSFWITYKVSVKDRNLEIIKLYLAENKRYQVPLGAKFFTKAGWALGFSCDKKILDSIDKFPSMRFEYSNTVIKLDKLGESLLRRFNKEVIKGGH